MDSILHGDVVQNFTKSMSETGGQLCKMPTSYFLLKGTSVSQGAMKNSVLDLYISRALFLYHLRPLIHSGLCNAPSHCFAAWGADRSCLLKLNVGKNYKTEYVEGDNALCLGSLMVKTDDVY